MTARSSPSDGVRLAFAGLVLVTSLCAALLVPRFRCREGFDLQRDIPPPAGSPNGWICRRSDVGYVPHDDGLPFKWFIGAVGVLVATAFVAAGRERDGPSSLPEGPEVPQEGGGAGL